MRSNNMADKVPISESQELFDLSALIDLRKRFEGEQRDYLNFCYQYLNFYTGLILTILGATIAGIVQVQKGQLKELVLLAGPLVVILLSVLGYANVKVFFRRFVEAWVTLKNIETMLDKDYERLANATQQRPLFASKYGGFIARFERKQIEDTLRDAQNKALSAEEVVERITAVGDTLSYARLTFSVFVIVGVLLIIVIIMVANNAL
jgi:hypothetical protein